MSPPRARTYAVVCALGALAARAEEPELHLAEAVATALKHQPQILQSQANVDVARAKTEEARSGFFPTINGTASALRSHGAFAIAGVNGVTSQPATTSTNPNQPGTTGPVGGTSATTSSESSTNNRFVLGLTANQPLWDFSAIELMRSLHRTLDAQKATARATTLQVVLNVRSAFFAARTQAALAQVADENLANVLEHQRQIQGLVRAGINAEIDLAHARTDVANAEVQELNARNAADLALARLGQAMGVTRPPARLADDELGPVAKEEAPLDVLVAEALEHRPELESLALQLEAQELTVKAAEGRFLPTLNATGSLLEAGRAVPDLGLNWSFGAVLAWPLFEGGLTVGQIHEAQAAGRGLLAQQENQSLQVRLDVETAQRNLAAQKKVVGAAGEAVKNARELLTLAERRYQLGLGSIIELGDAQVAYTTARGQEVQAKFALATARAQLLAALGREP